MNGPDTAALFIFGLSLDDRAVASYAAHPLTVACDLRQESLGGRADYAAAEEEEGDEAGDAGDAGAAGDWRDVRYAAAGAHRSASLTPLHCFLCVHIGLYAVGHDPTSRSAVLHQLCTLR